MSHFSPSAYSGTETADAVAPDTAAPAATPSEDTAAAAAKSKTDMYTSLAQGIGLLGSGIITTVGASNLQRSQQQHETSMVKRQGKLALLQASASSAQASAQRAAAAVAGQGTKRTVYIVGGVLIGLTVVAGTVVYLTRKNPEGEE